MQSDKKIQFQIGRSYHNWLDIQGHACRFHHGDRIKYDGGIGGPTIPINKAIAGWNKTRFADYDFFGHLHQFMPMGPWYCNGSMIGHTPFILTGGCQSPFQTFAVIDRERGLTRCLPLFCN